MSDQERNPTEEEPLEPAQEETGESWEGEAESEQSGEGESAMVGGFPAIADPEVEAEVDDEDLAAIRRLGDCYQAIRGELSKVIVGQDEVVDQLLMSIITRTHALLVGVPGLAKTLLISTLSKTLHLDFKRIQFTPDLMPSDITGTEVMFQDPHSGERDFRFRKGPIFANIVLADEINRTPPKTQAALLEAMQERRVTVGGIEHKLPDPFFVLATQNPLEQEGTYSLPEAQLDRFMFLIKVDYPNAEEEIQIMKMANSPNFETPEPILDREDIIALQSTVKRIPVADHVFEYAEKIVRMTRASKDPADKNDWARKYLSWGAGPRASINLITAAKARAALFGNFYVGCEDVAAVTLPVLRHRIVPNFQAQSEGVTAESLVDHLLESVPQT